MADQLPYREPGPFLPKNQTPADLVLEWNWLWRLLQETEPVPYPSVPDLVWPRREAAAGKHFPA
jgi:hypothetical protein